jgi:hypothetical protein
MTMFTPNIDFAKTYEKQLENQRFQLPQPPYKRPKMPQDRPKIA